MDKITFNSKTDGTVLEIAGGQYRTIISGKDTNGKYAIIEMNVPPGAGPGNHAHKDIEEIFYVASGEINFRTEHGIVKAKTGDTIRIPLGGAVHSFKNSSDDNAKLICTVYPAGLEEMFAEVHASGPSKAKEIGEKYGNEFFAEDYFDIKIKD